MHAVDGGDVRVIERGQRLGLVLEAGDARRMAGEGRGQHLDRHVAAQSVVGGAPYRAHAPVADPRVQAVVEDFLAGVKRRVIVCHGERRATDDRGDRVIRRVEVRQQRLDLTHDLWGVAAQVGQPCGPLGRRQRGDGVERLTGSTPDGSIGRDIHAPRLSHREKSSFGPQNPALLDS